MAVEAPEEWPRRFEQYLNGGDLDGVVELYDPDASVVAPSGETIRGREGVRHLFAGMMAAKTQLHSRVLRSVTVGDVALLYTDFDGTAVDASGKTVDVHYSAIEVLRRQLDGGWKLIVGDPNARK